MTHYLVILGMFSTLHCRSVTYIRFNNFPSNPMTGSMKCELQIRCLVSVVPEGAHAMAPPDFGRSVNPISIGVGADHAHQIKLQYCNTGTPEFSDLLTGLVF